MNKRTRKQLEQEIIDLKINNHKDKYIHTPKVSVLPLICIMFFSFLAYFNLKLIDFELIKKILLNKPEVVSFQQLINIYPIIGEYVLVSIVIISFVALVKGGYNNLKNYNHGEIIKGLIIELIIGLIMGLIIGLIIGLITGLIIGLIMGTGGLIMWLILGTIGGLIMGLILGTIGGLIEEYE